MLGTRNNTVSFLETYNKLMAFKKVGKARRKATERAEKGGGGPMPSSRRSMVYAAQRDGGEMTPRQRRRYDKKLHAEQITHGVAGG